jgi:hypothetical protein
LQSDRLETVDYQVRPYQELAAAVILRAVLDYQPGPNRKEQPESVQDQARDFLAGQGEFSRVRKIWCQWSGIHPESLSSFVTGTHDEERLRELIMAAEAGMVFEQVHA